MGRHDCQSRGLAGGQPMTQAKRNFRQDGPSAAVRIRVMKRDRFTCTYCGVSGSDAELEIDHIHPVSRGGSHHISNLTTSCRACNQKKGAGTLQRAMTQVQKSDAHSLVGLYLHTHKDIDGLKRINWQGQIVAVDGNTCLVQLFSWFMGEPTKIEKISKSIVYSDDVTLYADRETWVNAADSELNRYAWKERQALRASI
jgi:HNH endonuclease